MKLNEETRANWETLRTELMRQVNHSSILKCHFDMRRYITAPGLPTGTILELSDLAEHVCDSKACLAGLVVLNSGDPTKYKLVVRIHDVYLIERDYNPKIMDQVVDLDPDKTITVSSYAAELLGLFGQEPTYMFYGDWYHDARGLDFTYATHFQALHYVNKIMETESVFWQMRISADGAFHFKEMIF